MKKTLIAIVACLFAFGGTAMAQKNIKLGHINSNELIFGTLIGIKVIDVSQISES